MDQEKLTVNELINEIISTFDNQAIDENFVSNTCNEICADLPINLETTPIFKDFLSNVKKLLQTKQSSESKRKITRRQVARKSTNWIPNELDEKKGEKEQARSEGTDDSPVDEELK